MNHHPDSSVASSRRLIRNSITEFLIFAAQESGANIRAHYEGETIWLTQRLAAELFGTTRADITLHLHNIYDSDKLEEMTMCKDFLHVRQEGQRQISRQVAHYNLDTITPVDYRVNSVCATQFRQWTTSVLRDFATRGCAIDRRRMGNGTFLGEDYFERLLDEIHEIRLSGRRFYQKVTDTYATSIDYNKDASTTKRFFATVQNRLHYAVHDHTAAGLVQSCAGAGQSHVGLTTWANNPDGRILPGSVIIGKNYLTRDELEDLGRPVNAFLDLVESRARRQAPMTMEDWAKRLGTFLNLNNRQVLGGADRVSKAQADEYALSEFEKFRIVQDHHYVSDFDRLEERTDIRDRDDDKKQ